MLHLDKEKGMLTREPSTKGDSLIPREGPLHIYQITASTNKDEIVNYGADFRTLTS